MAVFNTIRPGLLSRSSLGNRSSFVFLNFSLFTENSRLRLVFSIQNLTGLVASFLWLQNGIDQAVS